MYDFFVATICLLGLLEVIHFPLPVLMAIAIVFLYGKVIVAAAT